MTEIGPAETLIDSSSFSYSMEGDEREGGAGFSNRTSIRFFFILFLNK